MGRQIDLERRNWSEPTADELERRLRNLVQDLMRSSVKLGQSAKHTAQYREHRERISGLWSRFDPLVSQFRSQTTREARRATKEALHDRLCAIRRSADNDPKVIERPYVAWKSAIDGVVTWLDDWTR